MTNLFLMTKRRESQCPACLLTSPFQLAPRPPCWLACSFPALQAPIKDRPVLFFPSQTPISLAHPWTQRLYFQESVDRAVDMESCTWRWKFSAVLFVAEAANCLEQSNVHPKETE